MADTDYNGTLQDFVNGIAEGIKTAKHLEDGDSFAIYPSQFQEEISKLHDTSDVIIPFSDGKTDFILSGYNAYTAAGKIAGAMPDKRGWAPEAPLAPDKSITIPKGYHDGTKSVTARALDTEEVTFTIDPATTEWENNAIVITPSSGKDGMSSVTFKHKDNSIYHVNENDTAGLSDIRNYALLEVPGVDRAETELTIDPIKVNNDISNTVRVTASNIQESGYLFPNTDIETKTVDLTLSASGQYVYLKNGSANLAKQNVVTGELANPTFSFDSNAAIVTATSTLTKTGYLTKDTTTSNTFEVPKATRATNNVNIDRYAADDYEYVEIQVNNNQETGYVQGSNEYSAIELHAENPIEGQYLIKTIYNDEEKLWFDISFNNIITDLIATSY